jgi:hypothetical protein
MILGLILGENTDGYTMSFPKTKSVKMSPKTPTQMTKLPLSKLLIEKNSYYFRKIRLVVKLSDNQNENQNEWNNRKN